MQRKLRVCVEMMMAFENCIWTVPFVKGKVQGTLFVSWCLTLLFFHHGVLDLANSICYSMDASKWGLVTCIVHENR